MIFHDSDSRHASRPLEIGIQCKIFKGLTLNGYTGNFEKYVVGCKTIPIMI